ncbi:PAQR family membrane homeostasis protein TrhA [Methylophaga pinxianii]|uniref:PAQR family membrane homeostasis protein TrhA n=1 Tax=Methylophaga pinxianii TaxID=2881052 RepID=UPI001CF3A5D8|nr:hemolysin III family protein [Methylophaga pinxianii]MCB2426350.1 hemolysin III family protein [Methylophaga pinxianii]UPH46847.1 hemolysin III family protein [Methylophaga pinxianii]
MQPSLNRLKRDQSGGEEAANAISHALGFIGAVIGTPILINEAVRHSDTAFVVGVSIFCVSMIILYFGSTVYHALPAGNAKRIFLRVELSAIFLLIAGTYTPFTFGVLKGPWGWTLFGIIWALAAIGIFLKVFKKQQHRIFCTSLYLLMGWVIVIAIKPLLELLPTAGWIWLVAGGLSYTLGVVFFSVDSRMKYGHFIWHLFVLGGTTCHFFAILWYAA